VRLELPHYNLATQSPNKTRGIHWSKRAKARKLAGEHAFAALCGTSTSERQLKGRVSVTVTRWLGHRERPLDRDNAHAACKPLLDALVKLRVFEDDRDSVLVSFEVRQEREEGRVGTTVEVVRVGEGKVVA
jgi:hypothetical protein